MRSLAWLDRASLDTTSLKLDRGLSILRDVRVVPAPGRAYHFPVGWKYLPEPLRRVSESRAPRYGVLWLIIDR
jgi:hypothetical protein